MCLGNPLPSVHVHVCERDSCLSGCVLTLDCSISLLERGRERGTGGSGGGEGKRDGFSFSRQPNYPVTDSRCTRRQKGGENKCEISVRRCFSKSEQEKWVPLSDRRVPCVSLSPSRLLNRRHSFPARLQARLKGRESSDEARERERERERRRQPSVGDPSVIQWDESSSSSF